MHLNFKCLLTLILLTVYVQQSQAIRPYIVKSITQENGLSHADANTVIQDSNGFIWIGTYSGLDRYDGYEIINYLNPDPRHNGRILSISNSLQEKLWILGDTGIQLFDSKSETFVDFSITGQVPDLLRKIILVDDSTFIGKDYFSGILYLGRYNKSKKELKITRFDLPEEKKCTEFTRDNEGKIWIFLEHAIYIWQNARFESINIQGNLSISRAFITDDNHILCASENNVYYSSYTIDVIRAREEPLISLADFITIQVPSNIISDLVECKDKLIAVGTHDGLFLIQRHNTYFEIIKKFSTDSYEDKLTSDEIIQLFVDNSGSLWVSTYGGGVNYIDLNTQNFHKIVRKPWESETLTDNNVAAICEQDDYIWIGTNTKGVNCYHIPSSQFVKNKIPLDTRNPFKNNIRSIISDNENRLWIASIGGIEIFNVLKGKVETNPSIVSQLPTYEITKLQKDCYGQIWGSTWHNGLVKMKIAPDKSIQTEYLQKELIEYPVYRTNSVVTIYADPTEPIIYFSTLKDLVKVKLDLKGNIEETVILKNESGSSVPTFICAIDKQNDSTLWVGTIGNGCYKLQIKNNGTYYATNYSIDKHPLLKDAETVVYGRNGDVWIGGNGLYQLNSQTERISRYDFNDGLQSNSFKIHSSCKGKNGKCYFGGIKGLTYFTPEDIMDIPVPSNLIVTSILLNNNPLSGYSHKKIAYDPDKKMLSFPYFLNNIIIHFSALRFHNQERCRYRYKIDGVDNDWIYTDGRNPQASYSNLPLQRKMVFEVQLCNEEGKWDAVSTQLNLSVSPPWWASVYAYVSYVIGLLLIIIGAFYYFVHMINMRKRLEIKDMEERQKLEMHQMQLQFFINISHEFRTPLTLIIGSIDKLKKLVVASSYFNTLEKNAHRLLDLISELMDFRRAELGFFKLKVNQGLISPFVLNIANEFADLAVSKEISYEIMDKSNPLEKTWYDAHLLERIVINIIDNSFKYTAAHGHIKVLLTNHFSDIPLRFNYHTEVSSGYESESSIYICVSDTGVGISEPSLEAIFNRFYRIEDSEHDRHIGSGIGLALVKNLTMIHKGTVIVYSERSKGTDFIVRIPVGRNDYTAEEIYSEEQVNSIIPFSDIHSSIVNEYDMTASEIKETVDDKVQVETLLIVEDNDEIRKLIRDELTSGYNLMEAKDGLEALEMLGERIPDLIISDLMMPNMNGLELCRKVKGMNSTSHIPFIVLTARGLNEGYMESIESGADVYLTKPVEMGKLLLVIQNLLLKSRKIKDNISENYLYDSLKNSILREDTHFMSEFVKVIDENMSNTDMDVDFLCDKLSISRTKLYQKVKKQTGLSIMNFVKLCRLKKVAQLATENNLSMNEIMYRIGFQSQSHFSSEFKKEYGKTFSQFMQDLKK